MNRFYPKAIKPCGNQSVKINKDVYYIIEMNKQNDILSQIDRKSGLTVPPGYFEDFAAKMAESLPVRDELERPSAVILPPPTLWTRVRPYVYLAAMFAGVWCMLKMFVLMSGTQDPGAAIDNNPILAKAIASDKFINDFIVDDINQWDLIDEMMADGVDAANFDSDTESDFIDPASVKTNASDL